LVARSSSFLLLLKILHLAGLVIKLPIISVVVGRRSEDLMILLLNLV
jgi:hypothetical protein